MPDSLSHSTPSLYADDTEIYASSNDCADLVNKVNIIIVLFVETPRKFITANLLLR
jgi:hypothetical protein